MPPVLKHPRSHSKGWGLQPWMEVITTSALSASLIGWGSQSARTLLIYVCVLLGSENYW